MSVSSHTDTHSTSVPSASSASAHATGVADSGRWSTRRIAVYALFVALSMAVSFIEFPLIPGVPWLKYDPSGIVCLVAGFAYGPAAAVLVSVLGFVPHVFADPWGSLMAIAVALAMSVVAIIGNLLVTPIYADMTVEQVAAMIVPALLPFNLAKLTVHGVVTFLIYKPISNLLNR